MMFQMLQISRFLAYPIRTCILLSCTAQAFIILKPIFQYNFVILTSTTLILNQGIAILCCFLFVGMQIKSLCLLYAYKTKISTKYYFALIKFIIMHGASDYPGGCWKQRWKFRVLSFRSSDGSHFYKLVLAQFLMLCLYFSCPRLLSGCKKCSNLK